MLSLQIEQCLPSQLLACTKSDSNRTVMTMQAPVPIRTEVEDLKNYHKAEDYHQQYLAKGGRFGNAQSPAKGVEEPIRCYG